MRAHFRYYRIGQPSFVLYVLVVGFLPCFVSHGVHIDEGSGCDCINSAGESNEYEKAAVQVYGC